MRVLMWHCIGLTLRNSFLQGSVQDVENVKLEDGGTNTLKRCCCCCKEATKDCSNSRYVKMLGKAKLHAFTCWCVHIVSSSSN